MKESKVMKELRKIKREISKELYGKSWEEIDKIFKEDKRKWDEEMQKLRENKARQGLPATPSTEERILN
ncbi:MAG TPA: hypothetical protein PL110_08750 [Candidatus Eremiobacteraeota bacterium]|nr:MAG: hypothetical protein BWY64_00338 [bacterium ADurb.Bin363]HPZ08189.1 hypothetical protein [Candidatus Eremiobacteraeota bacterium]